jgi:hypothetical protein
MVAGFGDLNPDVNIRLAAAATLGMALGVESVTAGFLIGLVRQKQRPARRDGSAEEAQSPRDRDTKSAASQKDEAA